ncbi:restriction endonuclease subunit S [Vibrio parahaemolyticus]|nr:restriction endonuclease subunit S [Vibrio parahaemolyticus]
MNELPQGWVTIPFNKEVLQIPTTGKKLKAKEYLQDGTYPVVDQGQGLIAGYNNDVERVISSDVPLVVFGDHTRVMKYVDFDFVPGADGTKVLVPNDYYEPKYFYYLLRTLDLPDKGYSRHFKFLKECAVKVAPLPEQKRIVEKLDEVLAQVDTIKARLDGIPDLLKRFRQSVLASAVSGKLTEEWRELQKVSVLWRDITLKDAAHIQDPHPSHRTPKVVEGGVPYVSTGDLREDGSIDFEGARKVSFDILKEHNERYTLKEGDFVFGKIGTLGKATVLPMGIDYTLSANVILIQPELELTIPKYIQYFLSSPTTMEEIARQANSTSQAAFGIKKMRAFNCSLPTKEEQKEIVRLVDQYFAFADTIEAQVKKAQQRVDNLTQSILAKAFRGELVPQDPNDEPADKLLERIAKARAEAEALAKAAKKAQAAKKRAAKA